MCAAYNPSKPWLPQLYTENPPRAIVEFKRENALAGAWHRSCLAHGMGLVSYSVQWQEWFSSWLHVTWVSLKKNPCPMPDQRNRTLLRWGGDGWGKIALKKTQKTPPHQLFPGDSREPGWETLQWKMKCSWVYGKWRERSRDANQPEFKSSQIFAYASNFRGLKCSLILVMF